MERTLLILDWLKNVELRQPVHAGLNKGEARNALARAVFIHRLGEIRDRSFEQQRYRASALNLVTAAIVPWNTVYLERATHALREAGKLPDVGMLRYLSALDWKHSNPGNYVWRQNRKIDEGQFRPPRSRRNPERAIFSEFCGRPCMTGFAPGKPGSINAAWSISQRWRRCARRDA